MLTLNFYTYLVEKRVTGHGPPFRQQGNGQEKEDPAKLSLRLGCSDSKSNSESLGILAQSSWYRVKKKQKQKQKTEAQRGKVPCPKPYSNSVVKWRLEPDVYPPA